MAHSKAQSLLELEKDVISEGRLRVSSSSKEGEINNDEISRYSRQLLIFDSGLDDQKAIKSSKVIIIGAGGLGCPASQYLVGAGIGTLGILDYDEIETSNLHRQVLHTQDRTNSLVSKAESAAISLGRLNPNVKIKPLTMALNSKNALEIISDYDIVLDASDNVATRYLLNDVCVLTQKPLVSGSAIRFEGQLTVYNYPPNEGTTYRCLFPDPPPPETVTNCSDGGVLGPVPGVIGTLQALEALKIILGKKDSVYAGKMLLFDALNPTNSFRTVKLRPRKADPIEKLIDYEEFCGAKASDKDFSLTLLNPDTERLTVSALSQLMKDESARDFILIDVRAPSQQRIARLEKSIEFPLSYMDINEKFTDLCDIIKGKGNEVKDIVFICRRGNDSQKAVLKYRSLVENETKRIRDVIGGLHAWANEIDKDFPVY